MLTFGPWHRSILCIYMVYVILSRHYELKLIVSNRALQHTFSVIRSAGSDSYNYENPVRRYIILASLSEVCTLTYVSGPPRRCERRCGYQ